MFSAMHCDDDESVVRLLHWGHQSLCSRISSLLVRANVTDITPVASQSDITVDISSSRRNFLLPVTIMARLQLWKAMSTVQVRTHSG